MINLVTIEGRRYLVDVGFGATGPDHPLPLTPDHISDGISPLQLRLEFKKLPQHRDPSQRVWVYEHRESESEPWVEGYSFTETECFPPDFEVLNLATMTLPQSFMVQRVLAQRFVLAESEDKLEGTLVLLDNTVKRRIRASEEVMETLHNEEQRVKALEKWFRIHLSRQEREAIRGLASELRG